MNKKYLVTYYSPVVNAFNLMTFNSEEEMKSFCRKARSYIKAVYEEVKILEVTFKDENEQGDILIDEVKEIK